MDKLKTEDDFTIFFRKEGASLNKLLTGSAFSKNTSLPRLRSQRGHPPEVDLIEVDHHKRAHLWELKMWNDYDLTSGKVLGQMMMYDWLLRFHVDRFALVERVFKETKHEDGAFARLVVAAKMTFCSWNILICGGEERLEVQSDDGDNLVDKTPHHLAFFRGCAPYFVGGAPPIVLWHIRESDDNNYMLSCDMPAVAEDMRGARNAAKNAGPSPA